jgi:hypothetical protein
MLPALSTSASASPEVTPAKVKIAGSPAVYKPAHIKVTVVSGVCLSTNYEFSITNKTKKPQQVEIDNQPFGTPIPPKGTQYFCSSRGVITFELGSNPNTELIIHSVNP